MVADMSPQEAQFILPYVGRVGWNAKELKSANSIEPLKLPITHVRYTYTGTPKCFSEEECTQAVEDLQRADIKAGLSDIKYNFLIGAMGVVFEGRGWRYDAHRPPEYDHLKGRCLDIAYIGDFSIRLPPMRMVTAALDIITYGKEKNLIVPLHGVVPLCPIQSDNKDDTSVSNSCNSKEKVPQWEEQRSALDLLRFGVKRHLIHPAYKIIPMRKRDSS